MILTPKRTIRTQLSSVAVRTEERDIVEPISRLDEENIYEIPNKLKPSYLPLSPISKIALGVVSFSFTLSSYVRSSFINPTNHVETALQSLVASKIIRSILKGFIFYCVSSFILQEKFLGPSRISTNDLIKNYFLPSKLSQYQKLDIRRLDNKPFGVHWLQYDRPNNRLGSRYAALHLNHGFGASSLSWIPIISKVTDRFNIARSTAHDAFGFGFTDRPSNAELYKPIASSKIGLEIMEKNLQSENNSSPVILMGHSMGAITTLEMALQLPKETPVTIVLVAPALGLNENKKSKGKNTVVRNNFLQKYFINPPLRYLLRRIVGMPGFWKRGLQAVWGDSKLVTDSDALRFQWPSIGMGWEDGLLSFSRAISSRTSDSELLKAVVNRSETRVAVLLGSVDKVVTRKSVDKMFALYPDIPILEVEGCGHDSFEEKPEKFLRCLETVLKG